MQTVLENVVVMNFWKFENGIRTHASSWQSLHILRQIVQASGARDFEQHWLGFENAGGTEQFCLPVPGNRD